jgi:tetratricopeptide (TPR) repeat protein
MTSLRGGTTKQSIRYSILNTTLLGISVFLLLTTSCVILKHEKKTNLDQSQKLNNTSEFIDGCKEKILDNYDKAATHFLSCIKTDPDNVAALYELAGIYSEQKKNNEAITLIKKTVKLEPENVWYQQLYAELLVKKKEYKDATAIYEMLAKAHPENMEYYFDWAIGYLYSAKYTDAIGVYDMIEQKIGVSEDISIQKEKIYLQQNKFSKAVEEIQKLINAYPEEAHYYYYLADLYISNNMIPDAYDVYQKIIKIDPNNANIHLSLADYYRIKGEKEKSYEEMKLAFSNVNLDIDSKVKILLAYYNLTENSNNLKEQAYTLIDLLIKTNPSEAKAYSVYGDFLYRDKKITEAKDQYLKVISIDSSRYAIWEQLLLIESETNNNTALENESKRAIELFPEQAGLYLFNGVANYVLKKYDKAILSFNKGITLVVDNDNLLKQFYTYLGDAYYAKQNIKEAFSFYDKVLEIDPQNVYVLNNYSYYLSLRGEDLDKAEKMSKKTVDLNPGISAYLDTYGWVLYKQGKYGEAETWINKAIEMGGSSDADILEHLGDVMFKLGQIEKAVDNWKNAKEKGKVSDILNKKINDRKLYE